MGTGSTFDSIRLVKPDLRCLLHRSTRGYWQTPDPRIIKAKPNDVPILHFELCCCISTQCLERRGVFPIALRIDRPDE